MQNAKKRQNGVKRNKFLFDEVTKQPDEFRKRIEGEKMTTIADVMYILINNTHHFETMTRI